MDDTNDSTETTAQVSSEESAHAPPIELPARIDRYRVIRSLGQGGFGRVYLARDDELDRAVAIKVPKPERVAGPEDVEQYLAEARALAKLDHPHIVPVYDVGRTDDGLCYVVSKFVEGSELTGRLSQARLTFGESAELVAVVAEALHHAHTHGLVHRDIKPANILLDGKGKPYVADFGLALKDEDYGKHELLAGTPAYMSPEQARGEGHRVDGRSDIFSLGVVFYELLTGRRPFRGETLVEVIEQILRTEERPPRQFDDTIPRELERICQKMLAKRASERYSTASDLADDLWHFLEAEAAPGSPGANLAATQTPIPGRPESDRTVVKVVPKGLRSFDRTDADFFLELLPGPRDRDGLPESIRFWKARIESTDADATFKVGLIYGPSGCGKSSLVKAGLLPRLVKDVLAVYIEATPEETESRLLRFLGKAIPDLPSQGSIVGALAAVRRGRGLRPGQKVLLVLDQFEQWLFARRGDEDTGLVAALRHCDGERVQAIVTVRDDFWMAATRFMRDLEIRLVEGDSSAAVDLFDLLHARKVLAGFGSAYGVLPDRTSDLTPDQQAFLDQSVAGLAQDGKVISVRLALFAEMVKGKPWTPATLRAVGGTEGVGVTFLEETFSAATAPPEHRLHQKAAQAVLKALLPPTGTDIKGQLRSDAELREASGYAGRARDFADLIRILDPELRLITPTDPEGRDEGGRTSERMKDEGRTVKDDKGIGAASDSSFMLPTSSFRYYQLTHDYLVHSLRDWLTRKQRETRGGRAELRLAERSALWNAKPEKRYLPSVFEWANTWLLTRRKDWTEPQRRMMKRAGRFHGLRGLGLGTLIVLAAWVAIEGYGSLRASALVESLKTANTTGVPALIEQLRSYRRWAGRPLAGLLSSTEDDRDQHLRASLAKLALWPDDGGQADYLHDRLLLASPIELPVIWGILRKHDQGIENRIRPLLDDPKLGPEQRFRAACALASTGSAQDEKSWDAVSPFVADRLLKAVIKNPADYVTLIETLRPLRRQLLTPLASIFRDAGRSDSERNFATTILAHYAADDPHCLAELLMVADPKAYLTLFPVAEGHAEKVLPVFRAELAKKATFDWGDPPFDKTWTDPDPSLVSCIESTQGLVDERFAFCQTMTVEEFVRTAEGLRTSGYRPVRFRPFADGQAVKVAAVWTRDGRKWRIASGLTAEQVRQQDDKLRSGNVEGTDGSGTGDTRHAVRAATKYVPVDVAGYLTTVAGKPADRYAALWAEQSAGDDAQLYAAAVDDELADLQKPLADAKLTPRTVQVLRGFDGRLRYSGVWGKPPSAAVTAQVYHNLFEGNFAADQVKLNDHLLLDVAVSEAGKPQTIVERAQSARDRADKNLKAKPDDRDARLARAVANLRLGENQKTLDDLRVVINSNPTAVTAKQYRIIGLARLEKKEDAKSELEKFQMGDAPEHSKLYLSAVVAAELGEGPNKAFESLEAAIQEQPKDAQLRYDAARAYSLASKAISRSDKAKGRQLEERCLQLLREAIKSDDVDFGKMEEDADLDPIRDEPAFAEILKAGHPDRRYATVWISDANFEATSIHGLDPAAHLRKCRELIAQGFRPASWSAGQTTIEGPLLAASVWHRPVVEEEVKDRLAARQARAAVALARMGKVEEIWRLLRHSADPRLRSFIINWLNPLGADPKLIAAELDRLDSLPRFAPPPSTQKMDAVLFQPENSQRRALILALGTYGTEGLSPSEREPLTGRLVELYRNEPDSGVHGAAEWTLRQWKQQEKLKLLVRELMKVKDWGKRRWYVNGQGQTYAVIEGLVEFHMGSPPREPDRYSNETPRKIVIPRRFAIASKEVTVEQYQLFLNKKPEIARLRIDTYSPEPDGPMNRMTWYEAAAYCNWLSEQEGLPKEEWCYNPNKSGAYDDGMTIPADALRRNGYRLPTEAEWEYASRSGTITSRYYGVSTELLAKYAWYQANSQLHAWPGGSLLPNELGLFDMLGNVFEWVQDKYIRSFQIDVNLYIQEIIHTGNHRLLRGGAFYDLPAYARSANRNLQAASYRNSNLGFRPARTYH